LPIGGSMILGFFFDSKRRFYLFFAGTLSICFIALFHTNELLSYITLLIQQGALADQAAASGRPELSGQFISGKVFIKNVGLYIPFALLGIFKFWKKYLYFFTFTVIVVFPILFQTVFYRRFFVFLDIALIIYAALGIHIFFNFFRKKFAKHIFFRCIGILSCILFAVFGFFRISSYIVQKSPLITQSEFEAIRRIDYYAKEKQALIMVISPYYAPWVRGFTDVDVIAPGMFEYNKWNRDEWNKFWYTESVVDRRNMIRSYGKPVYIFLGERDKRFGYALIGDPEVEHEDIYMWYFDI